MIAPGNIYIADTWNHRIRKITPSGVVTTIAGTTQGFADGSGTAAQFNWPSNVVVDSSGTVYVADRNNHRIRKSTPGGEVSALVGSGNSGSADGIGGVAEFADPHVFAIDASGTIYVADTSNNRIRKVQ